MSKIEQRFQQCTYHDLSLEKRRCTGCNLYPLLHFPFSQFVLLSLSIPLFDKATSGLSSGRHLQDLKSPEESYLCTGVQRATQTVFHSDQRDETLIIIIGCGADKRNIQQTEYLNGVDFGGPGYLRLHTVLTPFSLNNLFGDLLDHFLLRRLLLRTQNWFHRLG